MKKTAILLLAFGLYLTTPTFPRSTNDNPEARSYEARPTQMRSAARCLPKKQLSESLITFRLHLSGDDLFKTKRALLRTAQRSPDCRSQVVQALITAMGRPPTDNGLGGVDSETYALWDNGADLLGELRATEALDLLIAN